MKCGFISKMKIVVRKKNDAKQNTEKIQKISPELNYVYINVSYSSQIQFFLNFVSFFMTLQG